MTTKEWLESHGKEWIDRIRAADSQEDLSKVMKSMRIRLGAQHIKLIVQEICSDPRPRNIADAFERLGAWKARLIEIKAELAAPFRDLDV
jgi:hypothetical protein